MLELCDKMKRTFLISAFFIFVQVVPAQNAPAFRQFYFNPYLFNPAFVGSGGYTEVFVFHRQQWLNFNNAPSASGFNIQYPTQNKLSVGFNFISQEVVALQNTAALLTLGYRIPLSSNQFLFFGLSGGMGSNALKLDSDYSNDPTIVNASANSIYADGNFGVLYTIGKLRLGFALPKLFGQKYFSPQGFGDAGFTQLRNQLYSISYKLYFGSGNFAFEPYFLYKLNRDLQNYWEGSGLVYYKDKIWVGGSYNETQGIGFFLGMDFKEKVSIGYSYELPPVSPDFIKANSHEIHVKLRLGNKRVFKWADKSNQTPIQVAKTEVEIPVIQPEEIPAVVDHSKAEPRKSTENIIQPIKEEVQLVKEDSSEVKEPEIVPIEEPVVIPSPPRQLVMAKGYYIVVASFGNPENSLREKNRFNGLGYLDSYMAQNPVNKLYYVYIFSSMEFDVTRLARDSFRKLSASRDAWILRID